MGLKHIYYFTSAKSFSNTRNSLSPLSLCPYRFIMPYTQMGFRSGWIEVSEFRTTLRQRMISNERTRGDRIELEPQPQGFSIITKRMPALTTTDKPTKTVKTAHPRFDSLLKRTAKEPASPTNASNNLIPHWSYEKSSIAAACIFSAIAVIGLIFLAILSIRKIRRSWKRHKLEMRDYTAFEHRRDMSNDDRDSNVCFITESKSSRASMMYDHDNSPSVGYVVEQTGGSVTRVFREGNNVSAQTFDTIGASPGKVSPTRKKKGVLGGRADSSTPSGKGRAGSIPKPIVVVPSPLKHVSSLKATPVMPPTGSNTSDSEQSSMSPASQNDAEPVGRISNVNSLFRLPSIKKSTSPLFSF
ncbi:uncharacterized protein BDW43DRAFT_259817 [Aspergillus alliaceus]|uniref:uncharacterized protein n=1 Tax=Petromyces alliaceus TaxID=209559 RepID=UPI0012A509E8|nr:uncharacterized protein BDW43DRAFT_259817 [Aspergillus alliaceus]KAB8238795.1 hypothetical protein BDW43DRAFT_259817 [Aspergillus alliaceus]